MRTWSGFVLVAAIVWHLLAIATPPAEPSETASVGRDYASAHYAVHVAERGGRPWDVAELEAAAREDGADATVSPLRSPPPRLLVAWPFAQLPLRTALFAWSVAQELALLVCALALAWAWRGVHGAVGVAFVAFTALTYAVAHGLQIGQLDVLVLGLILAGTALEPERPRLGGGLVGVACALMLSPSLVVLWWAGRGRTASATAALVAAAAAWSLAVPLVGIAGASAYVTDVLPRIASGEGSVGRFGDPSLPGLWQSLLDPKGARLALPARALSALGATAVVGLGAIGFRQTPDPVTRAGQLASVLVAMVLLPVAAAESQLVFALPAMALAVVAIASGRLPATAAIPGGVALALLCAPLPSLERFAEAVMTEDRPLLFALVKEAKTLALLGLGGAMVQLGWVRPSRRGGTGPEGSRAP